MYKEFTQSKEIEFAELMKNLDNDMIFLHDEDTGELWVIKRYINDEFSIDEYETIYDRFILITSGKERFYSSELEGKLKYKDNCKITVWKKEN